VNDAVRLLALYFPQFHAIPENDAWWGQGFTDWVNVRKARPQYRGQYQPRVPQGGNYYDQSRKETLAWQIDLARRHGVHGFCHYHYWFDGKQLLETPTNLVLDSKEKEFDFPFCLAWANETWSRRWDGRDHHILQKQSHEPDPALWMRHFEYLFRAWSDERAVRIDGKPVFLVYRAHIIREIGAMFDLWRSEAVRRGLPGLYLVAMKQYEFPMPEVLRHFDATMQFQPFEALYSPDFPAPGVETRRMFRPLRLLPERMQDMLRSVRYNLFPALTFYDYEMVWKHMLQVEREGGIPAFPGAFVDWDNTARYVKRARIFKGASPERFAYWFRRLVEVTATRPDPERIIFMNAWNEWAEGTYLEPDERHGLKYLEAVRDGLEAVNSPHGRGIQGMAAD
jgi:hypothetical protein